MKEKKFFSKLKKEENEFVFYKKNIYSASQSVIEKSMNIKIPNVVWFVRTINLFLL